MFWTRIGVCSQHCFPTVGWGVDARVLVWRVIATIFTVAAWLPTNATLAGNLVLVTQEEVLAERQARIEEPPLTRAFPLPGAPKIHVLQPSISGKKPLHNPILIELQFSSASDADIDPASFRAYYGFLRIDLTERLLESVRVEKSGLKIENAEVPTGKHRLFLSIADSKERTTETELRFVVE
jgi:hypothetical protein